MEETRFILSDKKYAEQSRNKTGLIGVIIMNAVIAVAYLLEVVKGTREIGSYLIVAAITIIPSIIALMVYFKKKESMRIRYICGIGFALMYTYIMFTTTTNLTFSYIVVFLVILIVYVDLKFMSIMAGYAVFVNILVIVHKLLTGRLKGTAITEAEIIMACLIMTAVFTILAVNKIALINKANIGKANFEKENSENLLETTLKVATSVTGNVKIAVEETDCLKEAIGVTQHAMQTLTSGTNDAVTAIASQKESTDKINEHLKHVEKDVRSIMKEIHIAEEYLQDGNTIMSDLLKQVQISKESGSVVSEEMTSLKDYASKMQDIMGLISNVASQTELLALNASIEAARAGESGKGFAVVASEISSLASQTNVATGDIDKLIENITKSIEKVTQSVETLLEGNQLQDDYVEHTADNFKKIYKSTQGIVVQAKDLQSAVDIVADANERVIEEIESVFAMTEEVTASADETLEECTNNLQSIDKMAVIMNLLGEEVKELQG